MALGGQRQWRPVPSLAALHPAYLFSVPASVTALKSGPTQRRVPDGVAGGAARISKIKECVRLEGSTAGHLVQPARAGHPRAQRVWNISSQGGSLEILSDTRLLLLQQNWGVRVGRASCARKLCRELQRGAAEAGAAGRASPRDARGAVALPWEPSPAPGSSCSGAPG